MTTLLFLMLWKQCVFLVLLTPGYPGLWGWGWRALMGVRLLVWAGKVGPGAAGGPELLYQDLTTRGQLLFLLRTCCYYF
jgi:hypothetical protein